MRIFITGATGLIGRRVVADRLARGDQVIALSRHGRQAAEMLQAADQPHLVVVEGNPAIPGPWQKAVDGCDAVVHLAGASLAGSRWTDSYKQKLIDSRVDSTYQVSVAIREAVSSPRILLCASGVGIYGERGNDEINEGEPAGDDFLSDLAQRWEAQAQQATKYGVRVVCLRNGIVLDKRGGALDEMIKPFKWFVGGRIGLGTVHLAWVHWRDVVGLIDLALTDERAVGPINVCAPKPATNKTLARAIGKALGRPWLFPVPGFVLRIVLGEFGEELTKSIRAVPTNAKTLGYVFEETEIESAVKRALGERNEPIVVREHRPRVKLLAVAVDGVLLRSDGSLSKEAVGACKSAQAAGVTIVLASARPPRGTAAIGQAIGCTGPSINFDGAVIWNPVEQRQQYHEALAPEVAADVIAAARAVYPGVFVAIDSLDQWVSDTTPEGEIAQRIAGVGEPTFVGPLVECLQQPVSRLNFVGETAALQQVIEVLREKFWRERKIALFTDQPHVVRVTAPMVDKAIALQRLARKVGLGQVDVGAIGRGANDLGMIEWAGLGIVASTASGQAQLLADQVVKADASEPNDVVFVRAMEQFVLKPSSK